MAPRSTKKLLVVALAAGVPLAVTAVVAPRYFRYGRTLDALRAGVAELRARGMLEPPDAVEACPDRSVVEALRSMDWQVTDVLFRELGELAERIDDPGTPDDWAGVPEALAPFEPALARLEEAVGGAEVQRAVRGRSTVVDALRVEPPGALLPLNRSAVRALVLSGLAAGRRGEPDRGRARLRAARDLATTCGGTHLIGALTSSTSEHLVRTGLRGAMRAGWLSVEEARELTPPARFPDREYRRAILRGEVLLGRELVLALESTTASLADVLVERDPGWEEEGIRPSLDLLPEDPQAARWVRALVEEALAVDDLLALPLHELHAERLARGEWPRNAEVPQWGGYWNVLRTLPHFANAALLFRAELAVRAFHAESGRWPDSLAELVERGDTDVVDPFTREPIPYERTADGARLGPMSYDALDAYDPTWDAFVRRGTAVELP